MIKMQPKFKYDTVQYTDDFDLDKIIDFIVNNGCKFIHCNEFNDEYTTICYRDICYNTQEIAFQKGWYFWFDEMGLLNAAQPEYIKENYEIIEEEI